ncbi:MAG TPA: hypothetical protein VJ792_09545 [Candidatus Nitrosotalea sp.]|nr:hypothetical protein [Candidatus Nitrosotalea sp.]
MRRWSATLVVLLAAQPLLISILPLQSYADEYWSIKGTSSPLEKQVGAIPSHLLLKERSQNIPIFRLHPEKNDHARNQSELARISKQAFSMLGSIHGLGYDNVTPPDVQIAAGPKNIMEMVNLEGQVWAKNGTPEGQPFSLSEFYGTGDGFISDPKVLYDVASGRWFSSLTDISTSTVLIAVSSDSDAASKFCIYNFTSSGYLIPDQPILGVSRDKVAVSVNDFDPYSGQFTYSQFWVINKNQMLTCSPVDFISKTTSGYFSIHPVQSIGRGATLYMASTSQNASSPVIDVFSVRGVPPEPVSLDISSAKILSMNAPPSAPQPGTNLKIDTGDVRVQDAKWSDGDLWLAFNDGCIPSGDNVQRSCLHLVKIDTSDMKVRQDFDYGSVGKYLFYPAIAELPESHSLFVVYGFSSQSDYPGLQATMQGRYDDKNTLESPQLMQEGRDSINLIYGCGFDRICRFGDYFGAALDPSSHNVVWAAGEYGSGIEDSEGFGTGWGTEIANFTVGVLPERGH